MANHNPEPIPGKEKISVSSLFEKLRDRVQIKLDVCAGSHVMDQT